MALTITTDPSFEDIALLWQAMCEEPLAWYWTDWSPRSLQALVERLGSQELLLLAHVNGSLAGGCFLNNIVVNPHSLAPLHCNADMYILPAWRGPMGVRIGTMMREMILSTLQFAQFYVAIRPEHKASQRFAARCGMHRCGVIPRYLPVDGVPRDIVLYAAVPPEEAAHG
jgi:hypothetical protein